MKLRLTLALLVLSISAFAQKKEYEYRFDIKGLNDSVVYLGNYFAGKMYYNDTLEITKEGQAIFKGEGEKPGGVYALILQDKKTYFEFLINEPEVHMSTSKSDLMGDMKVIKSKENAAYYEYIKRISKEQKEVQAMQNTLKDEKTSEKEKEKINGLMRDKKKAVETYKTDYLKKYEGMYAADLLKAYKEPTVPEFKDTEGNLDKNARYLYFREHFFDNIDMKDEKLLRSPALSPKIKYYFEKLTVQQPDSIFLAAKRMMKMTDEKSLIYKYLVQYTTTTYENSKVMGMDAVFVHMAEEVYAQEKDFWLDSTKHQEILDQYEVRKNLIIGKKAENIVLLNPDSNWISLYDIDKDYTILFFWDPNCGHCKKEMPKLKKFYEEWNNKGVEVFAVSTDFENDDWKKFIKEKEIGDWINVSDNPKVNEDAYKNIGAGNTTLNSLNFRDYWDIFSTPQVYILDKDKNIIAKRIMSEQIGGFIENYEKMLEETGRAQKVDKKEQN